MKRGLLGLSLLVFLTQVISAQFFSGYGRFSIGDFFSSVDPQTIILTLLFLIFFALIFYTLSRFFKGPYGQPNKGIAGVIAFAVSSLIIYGLYRTGFDISGLFYDLGFSSGLLYPILSIIMLVFAILTIRGFGRTKDEFGRKTFSLRRGLGGFFMLFGLFILLLTIFTDVFYDKGLPFLIGLVLLVVGFLLRRRRRRRSGGRGRRQSPSPQSTSSGYGQRAEELRDKQRYNYYKRLEEQQQGQGQRRDQARELRRKETRERKVKERYTGRFGKRAWKKRERQGI